MKDILSAASLFLAFLGLIYSVWYPEISNTLKVEKTYFPEDNIENILKVKEILYHRAFPMTICSLLLSLILFPEMIQINFIEILKNYNSVKVLFCAIEILSIVFTIHLIYLTYKLFKHLKDLMSGRK